MENEIIELISTINKKVYDIDRNESLFDMDVLDSLGIANMVMKLETHFGIEISPEDIIPENFETITAIVHLVESKK